VTTTAPPGHRPGLDDEHLPPARRPRRRRRIGWIAFVVVLLAIGVAGGAGLTLLGTRTALQGARAAAVAGQHSLVAGDAAEAEAHFARARERFDDAHAQLHALPGLGLRTLPVLRSNYIALDALSRAGGTLAGAGQQVSDAELGRGIVGVLAPWGGVVPVESIRALGPLAGAVQVAVEDAEELIDDVDTRWLLGPVLAAHADLRGGIDGVVPAVRAAVALAAALPAFLGADEPRRYFVGASSPSELRGTGGLIGAYAIMEVREGVVSFGEFEPVQTLADVDVGVLPPVDESLSRHDLHGGTGFWLNINFTPDFPSAAAHIEQLYEHVTGEDIHGVIVATPAALASLMEVSGPVRVEGYGTLLPEDAEEVLANEAYGEITSSPERKRILGAAAKAVFERFLSGEADRPVRAARALTGAVARGDLLLYAEDEAVQSAFVTAGAHGGLQAPHPGELLAVVGNNASGVKLDYYTDRAVSYDVELMPGGGSRGTASVRLRNEAPTRGLRWYIIGPHEERDLAAGENVTILSTYCGKDCDLRGFTQDGEPQRVLSEVELGYPVHTSAVRLSSGQETELVYDLVADQAWVGDGRGGSYQLTFLDQATIRPTRLAVAISLPPGAEVTHATPGVVVEGRVATWEGEPSARQVIEVEWRHPPLRWLRR
jgi:hypothetical protein